MAAAERSGLSQRARDIFRALVQDYIHTGEPVASQPLLARHELDCSPATVRNVMADLEALGFLVKPHASSGRIPTEAGYRLYVDALLKVKPPQASEREQIEKVTHDAPAVDTLLESTARLLHSLSHHAAVVTTPRAVDDPIRQIEFVRLRESRVLVVFISEAGLVTNKLMQLDATPEAGELERAGHYLNEKLRAGPLATLRDRILSDMRQDQSALQGSSPRRSSSPSGASGRRRSRAGRCSSTARRASSTRPSSPTCRRRARSSGRLPRRTASCACSTRCSSRARCRSSSAPRASSRAFPTCRSSPHLTCAVTRCSGRSPSSVPPA